MKRVVTFLLAAGLVLAVAAPAPAAPPSSDPKTDAVAAAGWLGAQVNASGFIPSVANPANPNISVTVQADPGHVRGADLIEQLAMTGQAVSR